MRPKLFEDTNGDVEDFLVRWPPANKVKEYLNEAAAGNLCNITVSDKKQLCHSSSIGLKTVVEELLAYSGLALNLRAADFTAGQDQLVSGARGGAAGRSGHHPGGRSEPRRHHPAPSSSIRAEGPAAAVGLVSQTGYVEALYHRLWHLGDDFQPEIHPQADGRAARESGDECFHVTEKYLHPMHGDYQPMDGTPHGSPAGGPVAADGRTLSS